MGEQEENIINPAPVLSLHLGSLLAKTDPNTFHQSYGLPSSYSPFPITIFISLYPVGPILSHFIVGES